MRGFVIAFALLAAIPAMALPIFAGVVVITMPAALIGGIVSVVTPVGHHGH